MFTGPWNYSDLICVLLQYFFVWQIIISPLFLLLFARVKMHFWICKALCPNFGFELFNCSSPDFESKMISFGATLRRLTIMFVINIVKHVIYYTYNTYWVFIWFSYCKFWFPTNSFSIPYQALPKPQLKLTLDPWKSSITFV